MNTNIFKYRYRRLRRFNLGDITRRLEVRAWRKGIIKFIESTSEPITSQTIPEWLKSRVPLIEPSDLNPKEVNQGFQRSVPKGFLADSNFWKTFVDLYPKEKDQLIELADGVIEGRIELFGWKPVFVSIPDLKFLNSTKKAKDHGSAYYWDVNFYHDTENPEYDVKWLWELQRFQFLLWLGAAWKMTGDMKFPSAAREILNCWMTGLKYPFGVEWSSNLEVGLRLLSISRCHLMCMEAPCWDHNFVSSLISWEFLHAIHIKEELTSHHSLGNHPLGEASALLWFSLLTQQCHASIAWKDFTYKEIERMISGLIYPDGVYAEQSTGYQKFVLEFILPVILLGQSIGAKFSDTTLKRVLSSLEFVQALSAGGRQTPMIGDADSGSAIGWRLSDYWDFSWLLATGSTILTAPKLADGIEVLPAEAFLNVGIAGMKRFDSFVRRRIRRLPALRQRSGSSSDFPLGGYHVSSDSLFRLVFDSGPLGIYPGFGHGHADALSVLIAVRNKPVVVDTGTMHYNAEAHIRDYFRNTRSHNSVIVNGRGQSQPLDTFKWAYDYRVQWADSIERPSCRIFSGTVQTQSYVHSRTVIHFFDRGFIVRDNVQASGPIWVENFFHFAPDIELQASGKDKFVASVGNDNLEIIFRESGFIHAQICKGFTDPMIGWYSRNYGEMVPTNCLSCFRKGIGHLEFMTMIKVPGVSLKWPEDCLCI